MKVLFSLFLFVAIMLTAGCYNTNGGKCNCNCKCCDKCCCADDSCCPTTNPQKK